MHCSNPISKRRNKLSSLERYPRVCVIHNVTGLSHNLPPTFYQHTIHLVLYEFMTKSSSLSMSYCLVAGTAGLGGTAALLEASAKCWEPKRPLLKDCSSF